jgi:hypothetical protein
MLAMIGIKVCALASFKRFKYFSKKELTAKRCFDKFAAHTDSK